MSRSAQITAKVQAAMNEQVKNELFSAYQYLAMAAYLDTARMPGAAGWMRVQAREEVAHAMQFYDFIVDRNGRVELQQLAKPRSEFGSPIEAFREALRNEQHVTASIVGLYDLAIQEKDHVSHAFLQGFLTEQIEEEKTASRLVEMLEMAGSEGSALLLVDEKLGARAGTQDSA